jgi:uncharacterized protein YndB with AHSA1/START domain
MTNARDVETVERFIPAPASTIFALLADPSRHRDIDGSGTVREATTGAQQVSLGSRFRVNMKFVVAYEMESTIIEFIQDRRLAWQSRSTNSVISAVSGGRIWRYELEPTEGGTTVRESWDISQEHGTKMLVALARKTTRESMRKSLEQLEQLATG